MVASWGVVGGLYRDTVELEVQVWLATPAIDDRPPPFRVTEEQVAPLRAVYAGRNDDMPAWLAAIAALRSQGLEPLPQRKFFAELGGLMNYICSLITREPAALKQCQEDLPRTLPPAKPVLTTGTSVVVGTAVEKQPPRRVAGTGTGRGGGTTPTTPATANPSASKNKVEGVQHATLGSDLERTILKGFIATDKADALQKLGSLLQLPAIKTMLGDRKSQLALVVDVAGYEDIRKEMVRLARANGWIAAAPQQ